jgi:hypothetical protein
MADDDDWVGGEPPEGRHTREQSNPGYWANQWQGPALGGVAILGLIVIVVILVLVT